MTTDVKASQDHFFEFMVDSFKREFLHNGSEFRSMIIAFEKNLAWIIPFVASSPEEQVRIMALLNLAFSFKGITRYGYFFDSWVSDMDLEKHGYNPDLMSVEEQFEAAKKIRKETPGSAAEKREAIFWGVVGKEGAEADFFQYYDKKTRSFVGPAKKMRDMEQSASPFEALLRKDRFSKYPPLPPGVTKENFWETMLKRAIPGTLALCLQV